MSIQNTLNYLEHLGLETLVDSKDEFVMLLAMLLVSSYVCIMFYLFLHFVIPFVFRLFIQVTYQ